MKKLKNRNEETRMQAVVIRLVYFLISIFFISTLAVPVWAQAPFVGCNPTPTFVPNSAGTPVPEILDQCTMADLLAVPVRVFNWLLGLAGIVFLGIIIWGGTRMMLFYVSDAPEAELVNAKLTITRGIFGLLIIAFSYIIIRTLVYFIFGLEQTSLVGGWLRRFGL